MKYAAILVLSLCASGYSLLEEVCPGIQSNTNEEVTNLMQVDSYSSDHKWIFQGTRWCGNATNADIDEDLGFFKHTDQCCRAHHKCTEIIESGECKNGLCNDGVYNRKLCSCDCELKQCLKSLNVPVSNAVGPIYFDLFIESCFNYDYPIVGCTKTVKGVFGHKQCVEYEKDETKLKEYQWFDVPPYKY